MANTFNSQNNGSTLESGGELNSLMAQEKAHVTMHVNKFIHPCEKIPNFIKATDLKEFSLEYDLKENKGIADALISLDKNLIELLFGGAKGKHSRVRRF